MIDRAARDRAALALRRFAANRITNDEFDELYPASAGDIAVRVIGDRAWSLYSDMHEHRLDTGPELRREIARWVLFLHTELGYRWPPFGFISVRAPGWLNRLSGGRLHQRQDEAFVRWAAVGDFVVWPFYSVEEFVAARARPRFLVGARW